MQIRFIVATRHGEAAFFKQSLLVRSLECLQPSFAFSLEPVFCSSAGMAAVYNPAIERAAPQDLLVFVHDDVYVEDWFLEARLQEGLSAFDVIGVAGACARQPGQTAWWGTEVEGRIVACAAAAQSGSIKHIRPRRRQAAARGLAARLGQGLGLVWGYRDRQQRWRDMADGRYELQPPERSCGRALSARHAGSGGGRLDRFGPVPASVQLLDGVLIAARADRLQSSAVRFDPKFGYHAYDLDFCRQCERAGLSMGTWPIALAHGSVGCWDQRWRSAAQAYLRKWGD